MNHCEYDLGSRQGFGPVRHSPQTQAFHALWEKRVNAMYSLAVRMGVFNMDEYRHAIERMEPHHYRPANYHERSLTSLATLLIEKGLVSREELERRAQATFPLALPAAAGRSNVTSDRANIVQSWLRAAMGKQNGCSKTLSSSSPHHSTQRSAA